MNCEKCGRRTRKVCSCERTVRCYLYTPPSRSWKLPLSMRNLLEKKNYMAHECARLQKELELRSTLATVGTIFARNRFRWAGLNMNLSLSVLTICPTTLDLAILLVASLSAVENLSQCWELHHVGLSVHVEDEDDEKCCCQLKLNRSECCWTVGSNVLCCLLLKCNGTWGTPLPWSRWRLTRASADGLWSSRLHSGLLEDWDRHFSWRACTRDGVVVGEALHAWCQPWRCSWGTWRTSPSIRSPPETLEYVSSVLSYRLGIEVWLPRLLAPLFASTALAWSICHWLCPCFFTSWQELLLYDSTEFSTLQMLLWFGPSYLDWVVRQTPHRHMFNPSGNFFQAKKTLNSRRGLVSVRSTSGCPSRK